MVHTEDPPEIEHQRWRHKTAGYEVEVTAVHTYGPPIRRIVIVDRSRYTKRPKTWPATTFVSEFEPIGEVQKRDSLWQHL